MIWFLFGICFFNGCLDVILGKLEMAGVMFMLAYLLIDKVET